LAGHVHGVGRGQRIAQLPRDQRRSDVVLPGVDFDRRRGPLAQGEVAVGEARLLGQRTPPGQSRYGRHRHGHPGQRHAHQGDLAGRQQRPGAGNEGHDQPHQQGRRQRARQPEQQRCLPAAGVPLAQASL
jgi:hypothetical protein